MRCKLLIFLVSLCFVSPAFALSEGYKTHFKKNLVFFSDVPTKYTWGGKGELKEDVYQLDCSGYIFKAGSMAGMPVKRTVAARMAMGLDGWSSKSTELWDIEETDLIWWTWKNSTPDRRNGHIGAAVVSPKSDLLEVCHASSTKKRVVINPISGVFLRDISCIRRLTLGDKK